MRYQPKAGTETNDRVFTPPGLAQFVFDYFKPKGFGLDPSMGDGAFYRLMQDGQRDWCEVDKGRDFFDYSRKVDYIFTNPPWSLIRQFVHHGMDIADDVYYLMTVNHAFTKARVRDVYSRGFYIADILCVPTPKEFPQSGFQLGVVHWKRGDGSTNIRYGVELYNTHMTETLAHGLTVMQEGDEE